MASHGGTYGSTHSEVVTAMIWHDSDDLIFRPKRRDQLSRISTTPTGNRFPHTLVLGRSQTSSGDLPQFLHNLQLVHYPIRTTRHINPLQRHIIPPGLSLVRPSLIFLVQIRRGRFVRFSMPIAINVDLGNVSLQIPAVSDVDGLPPEIVFVSKGVDVDGFVDRGECS